MTNPVQDLFIYLVTLEQEMKMSFYLSYFVPAVVHNPCLPPPQNPYFVQRVPSYSIHIAQFGEFVSRLPRRGSLPCSQSPSKDCLKRVAPHSAGNTPRIMIEKVLLIQFPNIYIINHIVCGYVRFFEKFPSLNASSLLECLFKPEERAWAAKGGPEASILMV